MEQENPTGLDAYKPAEIAEKVAVAGVAKARLAFVPLFTLACLAGAFIAFGGLGYTVAMTGLDPTIGTNRFVGGVVFSLGLILVLVGGAELFTGNALMVMAAIDRKVTWGQLGRNWLIVYFGNFCGALALAILVWLAGIMNGPSGATALAIAAGKASHGFAELFFRGLLCNVLVCLAVWLTLACRTVTGKIFAILWPISTFVALGLEHSVANMFLIPQSWIAGAPIDLAGFAGNLVPVTLGNIVGGAGGVALAYRLAYGNQAVAGS
jgi:formate transporter